LNFLITAKLLDLTSIDSLAEFFYGYYFYIEGFFVIQKLGTSISNSPTDKPEPPLFIVISSLS